MIETATQTDKATPVGISDLLASKYPNNKPMLVTEKQLFERGMAIECRGNKTLTGATEVVCVNIFGIRETHLLANKDSAT